MGLVERVVELLRETEKPLELLEILVPLGIVVLFVILLIMMV